MCQSCHFVALHSTYMEGLFILLLRDEKDEIVTGVQGSGSLWEGSDASSSGCLKSVAEVLSLKACYSSLAMPERVFKGEKRTWLCRLGTDTLIAFSCGDLENNDQEDWRLYFKKPEPKLCVSCTPL